MTRAVVDSSVLVSALIAPPDTPPSQVLRAWARERVELVVSPQRGSEIAGVLARPKFDRYVTPEEVADFLDMLRSDAVVQGRGLGGRRRPPARRQAARGGNHSGRYDFVVARFDARGVLDASFGSGGKTTVGFDDLAIATGAALQPDGKLVIAGATVTTINATDPHVAVARLLVDPPPATSDLGGAGGLGGASGPGGSGGPGGTPRVPRCAGRRATIVGTPGPDTLRGTPRADVIVALGGDDRVLAGGGDDLVCGGPGDDRISGGAGRDRLRGEAGRDVLRGDAGRDLLLGGAGPNRLLGGTGRDRCVSATARDATTGCESSRRL